jgi:hypothetical protein
MSQGASIALQEFRPSYKRAAPLQAALAVICFLCSVVVWRLTGRWAWLAGGTLVGAVVPFTFAFIMTTNRLLLDAALLQNVQPLSPAAEGKNQVAIVERRLGTDPTIPQKKSFTFLERFSRFFPSIYMRGVLAG